MTNLKKKCSWLLFSLQEHHGGPTCHTEAASAAAQLWALGALAGPVGLSTLGLVVEPLLVPSALPRWGAIL